MMKQKMIEITRPDISSSHYNLTQKEFDCIVGEIEDLFNGGEIGDKIVITLVEFPFDIELSSDVEEFGGW